LRAEANRVSETQKTASFDIKITDQDGNIITTCQALAYQTGKPIPFL
jgi:acyl-CoA thioesterase